jgi:hypothetical protein
MKLFSGFTKNRLYISLLLAVFLGLLASRLWQQRISAQIWDEDEFVVKIKDDGQGRGGWSAIAIKN